MSNSLHKLAAEDNIHYFKVIQGQFMQLLLVLLGILFFPPDLTQQFSPVRHYFASSSHDRTARIWSMDRMLPSRIMAGHLSDVDCVQWHGNCNYIATGSSDKTVRLWDVQSGECVWIFIGHRSMILSLAMSPDGRYVASGDEDGTIMMWELSSGRCVTPLIGHNSCVWTLDFSGEGSLLASGSADCTVKLWDVRSGTKTPRTEENRSGNTTKVRSLKILPTKSTPVYSEVYAKESSFCCWSFGEKWLTKCLPIPLACIVYSHVISRFLFTLFCIFLFTMR